MARTYATLSALLRRDREWAAALSELVAQARTDKPTRGEIFARIEALILAQVETEGGTKVDGNATDSESSS